ncbi:MAG: DUF4058 family protein [Armatimonadetes bacterium]|nr:DUF4058 family protein [Armatimonadota bacterium]
MPPPPPPGYNSEREDPRMPSPFPGMDPYLENSDFWQAGLRGAKSA